MLTHPVAVRRREGATLARVHEEIHCKRHAKALVRSDRGGISPSLPVRPFYSGQERRACSQPLVAHEFRERTAAGDGRVGPVVLVRRRIAEDDDRARGALRGDAEDALAFCLLRVVPKPGRAAAQAEHVRPDQQPLRDPALVESLGQADSRR